MIVLVRRQKKLPGAISECIYLICVLSLLMRYVLSIRFCTIIITCTVIVIDFSFFSGQLEMLEETYYEVLLANNRRIHLGNLILLD